MCTIFISPSGYKTWDNNEQHRVSMENKKKKNFDFLHQFFNQFLLFQTLSSRIDFLLVHILESWFEKLSIGEEHTFVPSLVAVCHFFSLQRLRLPLFLSPSMLQLLKFEALESSSEMRSDDWDGWNLRGRSRPRKGAPMKPARFLRNLNFIGCPI